MAGHTGGCEACANRLRAGTAAFAPAAPTDPSSASSERPVLSPERSLSVRCPEGGGGIGNLYISVVADNCSEICILLEDTTTLASTAYMYLF